MLDAITKPELITGMVIIIGAAGTAANKLGWLKFGWNNNGSKAPAGCPDPACHEAIELRLAQIEEAREDIAEVKRSLSKDVFPAINATAQVVSRIEGRLEEMAKRR